MLVRVLIASCFLIAGPSASWSASPSIHFDLPTVAVARDVTPEGFNQEGRWVSIPLNLTLIVDSLPAPKIDQLLVQIQPLGGEAVVVDYSPRTELASQYATDIEVCQSNETADHIGVSLDAAYGQLASGNVGANRGEKNLHSTKFSRVAPMHVVASSGTTHRGRGVYFKLNADERQILEGEKLFEIVIRVPKSWRGELVEVRVEAEAINKTFVSSLSSFAGVAPKAQSVGGARFVVATCLEGDHEMASLASSLGEAEMKLRQVASQPIQPSYSASKMPYAAFRIDTNLPELNLSRDWVASVIERVIFAKVDPYTEPQIQKLPLGIRVSILDYLESRETYLSHARNPFE